MSSYTKQLMEVAAQWLWIAPFWKGPEEGAALVHTYKLPGARDDG